MQDITLDVNGDKGPNKWGRDKFELWVNVDKSMITPSGVNSNNPEVYCTTEKLESGNVRSCTARVLIEGKMDY